MTDLKPCPFCGSNEIMDMRYSGDARVQCSGCNASTDTYGDHAESHKAWNRRADHSARSLNMVEHESEISARDQRISEGAEILRFLIMNIESHGNYSPESTVCFLNQALGELLPASDSGEGNA